MTEEEAKTKWCPMTRQVWGSGNNINRDAHAELVGNCVGSQCMMWRQTGQAKFKDARTGQLSDRDLTGHGTWIYDGYCGLAGKP